MAIVRQILLLFLFSTALHSAQIEPVQPSPQAQIPETAPSETDDAIEIWNKLRDDFAAISKELATFKNGDTEIPPKTKTFLLDNLAYVCQKIGCPQPHNVALDAVNPRLINQMYGQFHFDNEKTITTIGVGIHFLKRIVAATTLDKVRSNYIQFLCSLAHELGHLNDPAMLSRITYYEYFLDNYGFIIAKSLSTTATMFLYACTVTGNSDMQTAYKIFAGVSIAALIAKLLRLRKQRHLEFTADASVLKLFNDDPNIPEFFGQTLENVINEELANAHLEPADALIMKSVINGNLNFLADHPTTHARVRRLQDLYKKQNAAANKKNQGLKNG